MSVPVCIPDAPGASVPADSTGEGTRADDATSAETLGEASALLHEMVRRGASDLHITADAPPRLRIDGELVDAETGSGRALRAADTRRLLRDILDRTQFDRFAAEGEIDFAFELPGLARFRGNCFRQGGNVAIAVRHIPARVSSLADLGLPAVLHRFAALPRGLVLVTGPTGSGKSTTLAAMVDRINRDRSGHIITLEDPVEFIHPHRRCLVNQREIGRDTSGFGLALRQALRQDPDVLLIGEMRDAETMEVALTLAETGHLVLSTLHTNSAADAVSRVIDSFPAARQVQVRSQLAAVLQGVATQILLPRARGGGRVAAVEVMVCTGAVRAIIRDGRMHQLRSLMQAGRRHGMRTLNDALGARYLKGEITLEAALGVSPDPGELLRAVGEPAPDDLPHLATLSEDVGWGS